MTLKTKILNLIDFEKVDTLLEGFNRSTGFVTAILDLEGNVLSKSGWRQVCTEFHRIHPDTSKRCGISDTILAGQLAADEKYHFYKCLNGLVDVAVPIVIKGEHIANLFSGQFFFEEPDILFFKEQAKKYGFDEESYLAALGKVPVIPEEKVKVAMEFLLNMTQLISEMTFQKLEQIVLNEELRASEERYRLFVANSMDAILQTSTDGSVFSANQAACTMFQRSEEDICNLGRNGLVDINDPRLLFFLEERNRTGIAKGEILMLRKDGSKFPAELSSSVYSDQTGQQRTSMIIRDITERKKAEEALKAKHELFRTTFNISPLASVLTKLPERIVVEVNSAFEKVLGFTSAEVIGKPINDLGLWADSKVQERVAQRLFESGKEHDLEFVFKTKTGETGYGIFYSEIVEQLDGKYVLTQVMDITERKQLEESLQANEARLRNVFEQANDGIFIISSENKYLDVNEKGLEILGYNREELLQMNVSEVLHPDEVNRLAIEPPKMMSGIPHLSEWIHVRKNGSGFPAEVSSRRLNDHSYLAIIRDLTERKHAENEIKRLNERITTATRSSQVGIWDWDIKNNILNWDEQMYALYGLKKEQFTVAYETWINNLHPDDTDFFQNEVRLAMLGQKDYNAEFRIVWPDGTIRYCRSKGEVFRDVTGSPIRMIGVNYDITVQKLNEKELQESEEYLKLGYETANLGIWKNDIKSMTVEFDERARNHYGFDESVVRLSDVIARIHPEDMSRLLAEIEKTTAPSGTGKYATEYRVVHPDGSTHWLYTGVRIIFEGEGENRISVMGYGTSLDITERKQAEEKIRESEERYRLISDVVSDYIFTSKADKNGNLELSWVTGAFELITGYSFDEYTAHGGWRAALHPDDLEKDIQDFEELKKNNKVVTDVRTFAKDGRIVWVRVYAHPVWDYQTNELVGIYGAVKDITEKKLAENALANSEARLHTLVQTIPDLIWLKDINGIYLSCNVVFERLYGAKEADIIGKTDYDFVNRELADFFHMNDLKAIEAGKPTINEEWLTFADDRQPALFETTKTPMYNSSGTLIGVLGIGHDITERKQIEVALKESNERLNVILENNPIAIWDWDIKTDKWFATQKYYTMLGYEPESNYPDRTVWLNRIHPDDRESVRNKISNILNHTDNQYSYEARMLHADGSYRWQTVLGKAINQDEDGNVSHMIGVRIDTNERKQAEEDIRILNNELEQRVIERTSQLEAANKELEAFSYSVSHDLRAPLRHINGYISLLNERYQEELPEKALHYLGIVTSAAKQMGILIDDLLQFSRTGRQEVHQTKTDMNILIKEVFELLKPDIVNRKINWSVQELPIVFSDYSLLKQVWLNLLDNAVKYTRNEKLAEISIGCTENQENVVFFVRDNGVGFDMKYAHKLFGVFQRLHSQSEFEGTGIGLANVQRIIHKHNGQVWFKAQPGTGATFFFSLPKNKEV